MRGRADRHAGGGPSPRRSRARGAARAIVRDRASPIGCGRRPRDGSGEAEITAEGALPAHPRSARRRARHARRRAPRPRRHARTPRPRSVRSTGCAATCRVQALRPTRRSPRARRGLQSARVLAMRAWVRTGVPRALRDYDEWLEMTTPRPRHGAPGLHVLLVEDPPASAARDGRGAHDGHADDLEDAAALAALVHALARHEADAAEVAAPAEELLDEAMYRAARATAWTARCQTPRASCGRSAPCSAGARARRTAARSSARGRAGGASSTGRRRGGDGASAPTTSATACRGWSAGWCRAPLPAPSLESRHGRPGAHPQLLDHRPHRPRQVDAGRPHPRADPHGRPRGDARPAARLDGPRARARDHDQGAGGARASTRRATARPTSCT